MQGGGLRAGPEPNGTKLFIISVLAPRCLGKSAPGVNCSNCAGTRPALIGPYVDLSQEVDGLIHAQDIVSIYDTINYEGL